MSRAVRELQASKLTQPGSPDDRHPAERLIADYRADKFSLAGNVGFRWRPSQNDDSQPLELNVMDNYQAGEIRPTRNLSGGESFLVSLSLALGLSRMASSNVRVDSLFLDEGFGTLDDDALESALDTLSNLNQEGKLIGIISHVPALKERISAQIKVTPQKFGQSSLSGPGCKKIPD